MTYDTTEAVAKFLSGFQMKITKRERDTVAPDYYVKYLLTLSKGGKDFSTTFVSDPRAFGEPTVTQVFGILPGADADGYSLSGEARGAVLSRSALPENRKAALDVIRKLNESRDSNENALF